MFLKYTYTYCKNGYDCHDQKPINTFLVIRTIGTIVITVRVAYLNGYSISVKICPSYGCHNQTIDGRKLSLFVTTIIFFSMYKNDFCWFIPIFYAVPFDNFF